MNVAPTLLAVSTCTDEKTTGHHDRTAAYPAIPTRTNEKTTGHHDRTATYPVGAPFMTPGTGAVKQTPTRHDGTHAAQQRTHAGDMNVAPTLPAVPTRTNEKTAGHHDRTAAYPAVPTCTDEKTAGHHDCTVAYPAVPTRTDEKTAGHHDRTVAYPVGAPFMTPGTEAVRQTSSCHDGAHAAQQRTLAGDMNVAPTLLAVPTCTDEKTAGHHARTAAYPVGAPFMTPGTGAERQTPTRHDGAHAGGTGPRTGRAGRTRSATTHPRGRHKRHGPDVPDAHAAQQRTLAGDMNVAPTLPAVPTCTDEKRRNAMAHARGRHECRPYADGGAHQGDRKICR